MSKLLALSINLSKLERDRFFKGKNGTYADLEVWIEDEPDKYGNDASVSEALTKEERAAKVRKNYVGNGKKRFGWDDDTPHAGTNSTQQSSHVNIDDHDVPF